MQSELTDRNFAIDKFTDRYGVECSLQESSLATESAIWFGCNDIGLKQFIPNGNPSWRDISEAELKAAFPHAAHFGDNSRMHLTQEMVAELLPALQHFVETGRLPERS